ncbi:MAG: FkbM family methyltransferase [Burkholderiaceae bacterium]|nr:FkbM family methyltransferase [Burkholderiaceae bacterium]
MSFNQTKALTKKVGLYRLARWVNRQIFDREELTRRRADEAFYRKVLKPGDLAFDVGANYGEKAAAMLAAEARVIAYEPQPDCMAELRDRIGPHPQLTVLGEAVGAAEGEAKLYVRRQRGTSGLVQQWEGDVEGEITVKVTTLKQAVRRYGLPTFVKIDVEGFELQVLQGLGQPVPLVSFEYHMREDSIAQAVEYVRFLRGLGPVSVNFSPAEELHFMLPEWLPGERFEQVFPHEIQRLPGCEGYGDVFVKMVAGTGQG